MSTSVVPVSDREDTREHGDAINRFAYRDNGSENAKIVWRNDTPDYILDVDNVQGNHANFGSGKLLVQDAGVTASVPIVGTSDITAFGNLKWASGTAFFVTLDHAVTADRVITVPDATDTLALLARSQTFSGVNTFSNAAPMVFSGVAARITGPFGDATRGNRPFFQSSAANGDTNVSAMPSGSNTIAKWEAYNNSTPGSASVVASLEANGSEARLTSASAAGANALLHLYTGTTKAVDIAAGVVRLPLALFVGGTSGQQTTVGISTLAVSQTLAAGASITVGTAGNTYGLLTVLDVNDGAITEVMLDGGNSQPSATTTLGGTNFSIGVDTGAASSKIVIYYDGISAYKVINRFAGSKTVTIWFRGVGSA